MIRIHISWKDPAFLLLTGLLLREAFSFWTGSMYDSEVWIRNAYYVAHGVSPYSYMNAVPGLSFSYLNLPLPSVGYLPLWSFILAAIYDFFVLLPGYNRFVFYFLIKQPPILGDVMLGRLMSQAALRWGGTAETARRILAFWMFFPYPILISAIWGQFDSLVAALWLASILSARSVRRSALDGVAIFLKFFPVIFVPYYFFRERGLVRWRQLLVLAIPGGFTLAAIVLGGWGLANLQGTVVSQGRGVPVGLTIWAVLFSPVAISIFPGITQAFGVIAWLWVPAVILAGFYAMRHFPQVGAEALAEALLLITAVFLLMHTNVFEQYLIYLMPLLLLDVELWHPERRLLFRMTWAIGFVFLLLNNDLLIRFVVPVFPAALDITTAMDASPVFGVARAFILSALAILFAIHLIQLILVLADTHRDTRPWFLRIFGLTMASARPEVSPEAGAQEDSVR
jgi:hypothetical protein